MGSQSPGRIKGLYLVDCAGMFYPAFMLLAVFVGILARLTKEPVNELMTPIMVFFFTGFVVIRLVTVFQLRSEMAKPPIELQLGGVATFFFGTIYFQYHLQNFEFATNSTNPGSTLGLSGIVPSQPFEASAATEPSTPPSLG